MHLPSVAAACSLALLGATSACSLTESKDPKKAGSTAPITVESSDDACVLGATTAPSGRLVFKVKNTGSKVTEFYIYDEAGTKIVAEVENIGPGLTRDLVFNAPPATYVTACKPGMTGDGIRADFVVTDSGAKVSSQGLDEGDMDASTAAYKSYVQQESADLLSGTKAFAAAYRSGADAKARSLYAETRAHWERIAPVVDSFGDAPAGIDTGWHRIEKDLWPPAKGYTPLKKADRQKYAADLLATTAELDTRVAGLDFTIDQIGNGSANLLREVAATKLSGGEEPFSHTDLWDIEANIHGAKAAFEAVEDLLKVEDAELYESIEDEFHALEALMERHRAAKKGFDSYERFTAAERTELATAIDAVAEPLSKLSGALTS